MNTLTAWLGAHWKAMVLSAGAALVLGFVVEHVRDSHRDAELVKLHQTIAADAALRMAATARTDTVIVHADSAVQGTRNAATGWTHADRVAARVPGIVASPKPDTVKIRELVATVDTLRIDGDSLAAAAVADTVAIAQLRASILGERAAWTTERNDLARALKVSESRHRHWGLGCTAGGAVVRAPSGVVSAGPGVTCGLTYRW